MPLDDQAKALLASLGTAPLHEIGRELPLSGLDRRGAKQADRIFAEPGA